MNKNINILKVKVKDNPVKREWKLFCTNMLQACINKNSENENPDEVYLVNYAYDEIEIMLAKNDNDIDRRLLSAVSIEKDQYETGNIPDDLYISNILEDLQATKIKL